MALGFLAPRIPVSGAPPSRCSALARSRLVLVQDMRNQARHESSGVKLEVNER